MTKTKQLTLNERLAQIEAERREWSERCDRLITASLERDRRVSGLLGDRDTVDVEVGQMFEDEYNDAAPYCPCETCTPGNVTCVNRD